MIKYIGSNILRSGECSDEIDERIGRRVRKCFSKEQKEYFGTIVRVDDNGNVHVCCDDTDEEDLNKIELGVWNASMKMYYALPDELPDNDSTSSGENLSESGATVSIVHLILILFFTLTIHNEQKSKKDMNEDANVNDLTLKQKGLLLKTHSEHCRSQGTVLTLNAKVKLNLFSRLMMVKSRRRNFNRATRRTY